VSDRAGAPPPTTTETERFLIFARWGEPIVPASLLLFLLFFRNPFSLALCAYVALGLWPGVRVARRLARRSQLEAAVSVLVIGFWGLALVLITGGSLMLPAAILFAIMSVVVGVPFASQRQLPWLVAGSTLTAAAVGVISLFPPLLSYAPATPRTVQLLVAFYIPLLVGLYSILVWQSSARLSETMEGMRRANEALRESERTLERKVHERTLELEQKNADLEVSQRDLAAARDEALRASRTKSAFLANMSHELRTPLNAIIGYSEMLHEEAQDSGQTEMVPDLAKIMAAGRHLLGLINDVLDLSKVEAGRVEIFAERFDANDALREVVATIQPLSEKNGNRVEVQLPDPPCQMHSDLTKLRQVLFNLLSNASKFTHHGTITLVLAETFRQGERWVEIRVSDSGIGMQPDQLERVFEPFTQADASTTRQFGGTGLGLAITKSFCEMLGGEIAASSRPGEGSEFTVRLPAEVAQPEAEPETSLRPAAAPRADATTVLVVDDDPAARDLMKRFLNREGFRVVTAASGPEGLERAREEPPDIITLDVLMPGMDGWAVLAELKADPDLLEIPVIVVTITDDQNLGYALGASDYMTKPIDRRRLATVLHQYEATGHGAPVLVVEDDHLSRSLMREAVERAGGRGVEAENGQIGLEQVRRETPALILLDLMMPVMDGFEFLEELRREANWRDIPVVVVTAKDLSPEERKALGLRTERILEKGALRRDGLLERVRELVRRHLPGARISGDNGTESQE